METCTLSSCCWINESYVLNSQISIWGKPSRISQGQPVSMFLNTQDLVMNLCSCRENWRGWYWIFYFLFVSPSHPLSTWHNSNAFWWYLQDSQGSILFFKVWNYWLQQLPDLISLRMIRKLHQAHWCPDIEYVVSFHQRYSQMQRIFALTPCLNPPQRLLKDGFFLLHWYSFSTLEFFEENWQWCHAHTDWQGTSPRAADGLEITDLRASTQDTVHHSLQGSLKPTDSI